MLKKSEAFFCNKSRGILYYFDAERLTRTLVGLGKMESPIVENLSGTAGNRQY